MPQELTEKEKKFLEQAQKSYFDRAWWMYFMALLFFVADIFVIIRMKLLAEPKTPYELVYHNLGICITGKILLIDAIFIGLVWLNRKYLRIIKKLRD